MTYTLVMQGAINLGIKEIKINLFLLFYLY